MRSVREVEARQVAGAMLSMLGFVMITRAAEPPRGAATVIAAEPASVALQRESVNRQKQSLNRQLSAVSFARVPRNTGRNVEFLAPLFEPVTIDCGPLRKSRLESLISTAAKKNRLSPAVLRAVIHQESGFNPCAISYRGAQGLMQLMPETAYEMGVVDPFDPRQNIDGGAYYLKQLLDRYSGDLKLALSAYNAGPARVDLEGGIPDLPETENYVAAVCASLDDGTTKAAQVPRCEPSLQTVAHIK